MLALVVCSAAVSRWTVLSRTTARLFASMCFVCLLHGFNCVIIGDLLRAVLRACCGCSSAFPRINRVAVWAAAIALLKACDVAKNNRNAMTYLGFSSLLRRHGLFTGFYAGLGGPVQSECAANDLVCNGLLRPAGSGQGSVRRLRCTQASLRILSVRLPLQAGALEGLGKQSRQLLGGPRLPPMFTTTRW